MGLKDLWDKITGNTGPKLTTASGEVARFPVEHLAADVDKVLGILASSAPGALATDSTTVIFVPTDREVLPVKDPKKGWILPLSSEVADKLGRTPGDYEINPQIAFVVI